MQFRIILKGLEKCPKFKSFDEWRAHAEFHRFICRKELFMGTFDCNLVALTALNLTDEVFEAFLNTKMTHFYRYHFRNS